MKKNLLIAALFVLFVSPLYIGTQLTIFVIHPMGALPEGKTIVIMRLNKTEFIDSPDGMCERIQGGVNLLCRAAVMASVHEHSKILFELPYSSLLYGISTGWKKYSN